MICRVFNYMMALRVKKLIANGELFLNIKEIAETLGYKSLEAHIYKPPEGEITSFVYTSWHHHIVTINTKKCDTHVEILKDPTLLFGTCKLNSEYGFDWWDDYCRTLYYLDRYKYWSEQVKKS